MGSELTLRIISGLVLGAAAIGAAWWGGIPLALFWLLAAVAALVEWWRLTGGHVGWRFAGLLYAGTIFAAPFLLRSGPVWGFAALIWLFAVVWGSDVMAYVFGRLIGGPKLWPRVSPKKTWAGFIGGTGSAAVLGTLVAMGFDAPRLWPIAVLSFLAAVATQGGDLFESSMKRRFGVKDSGAIIPGHGGVMDRLDGFVFAGAFALLIGLLRGGWAAPGQGLLVW